MPSWIPHKEKVTAIGAGSTLISPDISDIPQDEDILVLLSNEGSVAARIGFGAVTANSPQLAVGNERILQVPASSVKIYGSGVGGNSSIGIGVFRAKR